MGMLPLMDTSEARYGEIARIMAETGDWITPWFNYGVPFWGKPPLSFWAEALSFRVFGVTEFAARLPSWLASLGTLALIYHLTRAIAGQRQALIAALVFSTMALSFIMSGAVLTDPFLALGTTLALVSIILALRQPDSLWYLWFFVGISIGLLAKGPLALVLIGGPLALWMMWRRQWRDLYRLPWGRGLLLAGILSIPWYIAAEIKTPGFINYFIVGEHFLRFIDSGWNGDLYGNAHDQVFGTIWLHWLAASFPWGLIAVVILIWYWINTRKQNLPPKLILSDEQRLLILFALFPGLFFTFSGNILWTYHLPGLVPLSILIAMLIETLFSSSKFSRSGVVAVSIVVPLIISSLAFYAYFNSDRLKTEKQLIAHYEMGNINNTAPLIYVGKAPFSARFYSKGRVETMELEKVVDLIENNTESAYFVAIANQNRDILNLSLKNKIKVELTNRRFTLYSTTP